MNPGVGGGARARGRPPPTPGAGLRLIGSPDAHQAFAATTAPSRLSVTAATSLAPPVTPAPQQGRARP